MSTKWIVLIAAIVLVLIVLIPILPHFRQAGQTGDVGKAQKTEKAGEVRQARDAGKESFSGPLKYSDGLPDGKKSLGGSGEMIEFSVPISGAKVTGIRVHGSRYGTPAPPAEDFVVSFLNEDMSVIHQENAPYSLFERGEGKWVEVRLREPVRVPQTFWVVLDFKAGRTKGVYVSYDTSTDGRHSRTGTLTG